MNLLYEIAIPLTTYVILEVEAATPTEACEGVYQRLLESGGDIKFDKEQLHFERVKIPGEDDPWAVRNVDHLMFHVAKRLGDGRNGSYWEIDQTLNI